MGHKVLLLTRSFTLFRLALNNSNMLWTHTHTLTHSVKKLNETELSGFLFAPFHGEKKSEANECEMRKKRKKDGEKKNGKYKLCNEIIRSVVTINLTGNEWRRELGEEERGKKKKIGSHSSWTHISRCAICIHRTYSLLLDAVEYDDDWVHIVRQPRTHTQGKSPEIISATKFVFHILAPGKRKFVFKTQFNCGRTEFEEANSTFQFRLRTQKFWTFIHTSHVTHPEWALAACHRQRDPVRQAASKENPVAVARWHSPIPFPHCHANVFLLGKTIRMPSHRIAYRCKSDGTRQSVKLEIFIFEQKTCRNTIEQTLIGILCVGWGWFHQIVIDVL